MLRLIWNKIHGYTAKSIYFIHRVNVLYHYWFSQHVQARWCLLSFIHSWRLKLICIFVKCTTKFSFSFLLLSFQLQAYPLCTTVHILILNVHLIILYIFESLTKHGASQCFPHQIELHSAIINST